MSKCVSCMYYDRKSARAGEARGVQWGLCRRDAPRLNPVNAKTHAIEGVWPTVRDDDWCGRWHAQTRRAGEAVSTAASVGQMPPALGGPARALPTGGAAVVGSAMKPPIAKPPLAPRPPAPMPRRPSAAEGPAVGVTATGPKTA